MGWLEQRKRERDDELLSAYIDGQLLGRARSEFEARLAREPELRARLETTRRMLGMVRSLPTVPAPRNFILDPARYGARARPRSAARLYPTLRLATALATLVLLVVFASDLITQVALPFGAAAPALPQPASESDRGALGLSATTAAPQPGQPLPQAVPQFSAVQPTQPPVPPTQAPEAQMQPTTVAKAAGPQVKATPSPPALGRPSSQPPVAGGGQTDMSATPTAIAPSVAAVPATPPPPPPAPTVAPSPVPPTPTAMPSPVPPTGVAVSQAPPAAPQEQPPASAYEGERPVGPNPWRIAEAGLVALVIVLAAATILARRSA